jgi:hypothetical protein
MEKIMTPKASTIIVYGLDSERKPHAAKFSPNDAALARKAASLMKFAIGTVDAVALAQVLKDTPDGKLFATGRALVPLVRLDVFDRLRDAMKPGPVDAKSEAHDKGTEPEAAKGKCLDLWTKIGVGCTVLYGGKQVDDGWWEAIVQAVSKDGDTLTLRWKDAPKEKQFKCKRNEVGILRLVLRIASLT